jgi:hypothetical protein
MRVATTQSGETLEQLATRVYALEKPSASQLRAATTALTEANLFLRKPDEVPPGTVLVVPEQGGLAGGEPAAPIVAGLAADQLRGAIAVTGKALSDALDAEVASGKTSAKLARSSDIKSAAAGEETVDVESLRLLAGNADQRVADARTLRSYQKDVFAQIASDLDGLLATLGGGNTA